MKRQVKQFLVNILNMPLSLLGVKYVSAGELYRTRGGLVEDTATAEMLQAGALRQWRRIHDPAFQQQELEEKLDRIVTKSV